jgi:hypothetical protein
MIGKKDDSYFIITSNKVTRSKMHDLESAIKQVNDASKEDLKEMYRKQITEGRISEKGGAGLGLIEIAKRTRNKLVYQFLPIGDEESFFFILKVEINTKRLSE